jgi:type II secretory pathway predicted ATPase ExeA
MSYRAFFGLTREPFGSDLGLKEILQTPDLVAVKERFDYAINLGAMALVTGDIGSGKSTALRFASGQLHPSQWRTLSITATSGSILEFYRQMMAELAIEKATSSRAVMIRLIKGEIQDILRAKKLKVVLIVDEASLMRMEVFAELHTIAQFHQDSKGWLPIILAGQSYLQEKLKFRFCQPLASRIVARSHLDGLSRDDMEQYLTHHLAIAGIKRNLFDETAVTAIHQGSGGLLRKANHLARGALIAAAKAQSAMATADHVRIASTEVF